MLSVAAMTSMFGASIFSPSPTPACSQHGSRISFYAPQRMPFLKLSEVSPNSSWSLSFILKAQVASVSETIEIPATSETLGAAAEVPARHSHLIPLISELTEGAHLPSAVEPWLDKLSIFDWEALLLNVGSKDWTIAWELVSYFKEKAPVLADSVLWPQPTKTTEFDVNEHGETEEGDSLPAYSAAEIESDDKAASSATPKRSPPVVKLYKSLAKVLSKSRRVTEIDQLHQQMKAEGIEPVPSFYNVMLGFYISESLTEKTSALVSEMEKAGIYPTPYTYEKIAFMFIKKKPLDLTVPTNIMRDLIKRGLPVTDGIFKNLLKGYWRNKDVDGVEEVFQAMQAAGHTPDQKAIFKVMYCQKQAGNYKRILELMELMTNLGITPNLNVYDELIYAYCKAGLMEKAKESLSLYNSKLGKKPTLVAFNNLIHGYGKQGRLEEALQAFEDIQTNNYRPDAVSYGSIIAALVNAEQLTKAVQLYRRMVRQSVQPKLHTYITLIRGHTKLDWTREGRKIVKAMRKSSHEMTPEAFGAISTLFLEGHWYHLAASVLAEIETKGISLDAEANAALIRSFGILGDKPTPLSKTVEKSNLAICKLLTSLFLTHSDNVSRMEGVFEENVLRDLETFENIEHATAVYNAFMECFWRRGFKMLVRRLLSSAREVYAQSTKPAVVGSDWVLDVRGLSVGGAKAALIEWLGRVAESFVESADDSKKVEAAKMVIVTGNEFQLHVIQDHRVLKRLMTDVLIHLNGPFVESSEDPKKLEAAAADVMKWVGSEKVKELMDFTNVLSL